LARKRVKVSHLANVEKPWGGAKRTEVRGACIGESRRVSSECS
jgi:hypothetical protein